MAQDSSISAATHADNGRAPSAPDALSSTKGAEEGRFSVDDSGLQLDQPPEEKPPEDVPPDGGYGWVCVACASAINANTWGVNSVSEIPIPLSRLS